MRDFEERYTGISESEMQMFRFLLERPEGVILTVETDMVLARLLAAEELAVYIEEDNIAIIPDEVRADYERCHSDELTLRWRKRNWMYKCIEAGKYLYGVMTWGILQKLFALRYPHAEMDEVKEYFAGTPANSQWFGIIGDRLVLNGFEQDDYYIYLESEIQRGVTYYIPTREEVEELYDQGSLLSLESHVKLLDYLKESLGFSDNDAALKMHDLYEAVNNRTRVNDIGKAAGITFDSDEQEVKFIELFLEMSRDCRIRDNRGHNFYEMTAIMAERNRNTGRAKTGRNEMCPCGSGLKYKNCCGRS